MKGKKLNALNTGRDGFTLIEILVSFALIGIIAVIVASALRLGVQTAEKGADAIDSLERLRTAVNIIDSQIQSFVPLKPGEDGEGSFYFHGARDYLQFSTNYSLWDGQKGYVLVSYNAETTDNGTYKLLASENIIGMDTGRETTVLNALDNVYFEYFFKDATEAEGQWTDSWENDAVLPEKVRIHLGYKGKDIPMVIPLRAREPFQESSKKAVSGLWFDVKKAGAPQD